MNPGNPEIIYPKSKKRIGKGELFIFLESFLNIREDTNFSTKWFWRSVFVIGFQDRGEGGHQEDAYQ